LLDIKPQPIFLKGFVRGGFIAQDIPHVLALPRSRHGQMHGPIALFGEADPVPETGLPPGHSEALNLAATTPRAREPKAALDPDPPMPAQALQMGNRLATQNLTLATAPVDSVLCGHGHPPHLTTGTLGPDPTRSPGLY